MSPYAQCLLAIRHYLHAEATKNCHTTASLSPQCN